MRALIRRRLQRHYQRRSMASRTALL